MFITYHFTECEYSNLPGYEYWNVNTQTRSVTQLSPITFRDVNTEHLLNDKTFAPLHLCSKTCFWKSFFGRRWFKFYEAWLLSFMHNNRQTILGESFIGPGPGRVSQAYHRSRPSPDREWVVSSHQLSLGIEFWAWHMFNTLLRRASSSLYRLLTDFQIAETKGRF